MTRIASEPPGLAGPPRERRGAPRVALRAQVIYRHAGLWPAQAVDVADGGLSLLTSEPMEVGWEVDLYLHRRALHLAGTVVYVQALGPRRHRVGVRFGRRDAALAGALLAGQPLALES